MATASPHPVASQHLPAFITAPGETDVLMVATAIILVISVVVFGVLFFRLHALPEQIAHKSHKLQFEFVAVLALISLFTHMHIFWIAGLLLALIDFPDFGGWMGRIAGATEKIAGIKPDEPPTEADVHHPQHLEPVPRPPAEAVTAIKRGDSDTAERPEMPARWKGAEHA